MVPAMGGLVCLILRQSSFSLIYSSLSIVVSAVGGSTVIILLRS